jgi:RNA polymerase sigma-70 factor (ECF subfamily)
VRAAAWRGVGGRFTASRNGDVLVAMLAADVSFHADGGGKRPPAMQPIVGFAAVM